MADIAKCFGLGCEKRDSCYRFTAPNNEHWQSYAAFDADPANCKDYWPNKCYSNNQIASERDAAQDRAKE